MSRMKCASMECVYITCSRDCTKISVQEKLILFTIKSYRRPSSSPPFFNDYSKFSAPFPTAMVVINLALARESNFFIVPALFSSR